MIKSINKINVKDGQYNATWSGFVITILRPEANKNPLKPYGDYSDFKNGGLALDVEVNKGIKGITRLKVEVIDGWVYVDLSVEDRRELKLKTILE